jgi:large subunit ribosomal protein L25
MDQIELDTRNRELLGKKVRFLRRQGITPVHLFGHGIESKTLQCDTAELQQVLAEAGQTRLINLKLDKEKRPRTAVVREIQIEPQTDKLLHVDFYQVKMEEKVKVEVPVVLVGEAPALHLKENMLVRELNTLTVECLPAKIPASAELDLSPLTEADQAMRVKDIELDEEVTVLNDPELVVARISIRHIEKVEEVVVEAVEAVEAAEEAPSPEEGPKKE